MQELLNAPVLLTVLAIVVIVIALLVALMLISRNYIKVSPNQAAVISGRRRKLADGTVAGYRLVRGGATLVFPFLEKVEYLDLNVITVPLATTRADVRVLLGDRRHPPERARASARHRRGAAGAQLARAR